MKVVKFVSGGQYHGTALVIPKKAFVNSLKRQEHRILLIDQRTSSSSVSDDCFRDCCSDTIPVISDLKPEKHKIKIKHRAVLKF